MLPLVKSQPPSILQNRLCLQRGKEKIKCILFCIKMLLLKLVTCPLQLSDAGAGFVFGRKLGRPWLSPSDTADRHLRVQQNYRFVPPSAVVQTWGLVSLKPIPQPWYFGTEKPS